MSRVTTIIQSSRSSVTMPYHTIGELNTAADQPNAEWGSQTLRQACYRENPKAQCAFKILMIHEVLQFALRIAFRCVLHRCGNLDIHR